MPQAETKFFGLLDYETQDVVTFPSGIPGFDAEKSFLLIERADTKPVLFLQSLAHLQVCFPLISVGAVCPDYQVALSAEEVAALGVPSEQDHVLTGQVIVFALVTLSDAGATVNLLAPVVLAPHTRRGVQSIQTESSYTTNHPLELGGATSC
jgi:flagellar assembly factor FliW